MNTNKAQSSVSSSRLLPAAAAITASVTVHSTQTSVRSYNVRTFLSTAAAAVALAFTFDAPQATADTLNVLPDEPPSSASASAGVNSIGVSYTLKDALDMARGGDTISLADGYYRGRVRSTVSGFKRSPIKIIGSKEAVLQASSPSVLIEHSWITLKGFTVDGYHGDDYEADSFVNKCVEVRGQGQSDDEPLEGFVMKGVTVQNCGGECVRLKNFVVGAKLVANTIQNCGLYDFKFGDQDEKNGEGIYIGTSFKQWSYGEDRCNNNLVKENTILTCGNECVEVKEGSSGNVIERNSCAEQRDDDSGCFCSRGDGNTIRNNYASACEGAGVRLGGWTDENGHQHGQNNHVYGNSITGAQNGALNVNVMPQGVICENVCGEGTCGITGANYVGDIGETWDASC